MTLVSSTSRMTRHAAVVRAFAVFATCAALIGQRAVPALGTASAGPMPASAFILLRTTDAAVSIAAIPSASGALAKSCASLSHCPRQDAVPAKA
jgi:hypothetical protein